nr:hypothetical protein RVX_2471 [Nitratidesulfovibrio sp. HK-II]
MRGIGAGCAFGDGEAPCRAGPVAWKRNDREKGGARRVKPGRPWGGRLAHGPRMAREALEAHPSGDGRDLPQGTAQP